MTATLDRREALDGADYVINSVQVGGHAATVRDHAIPPRHGVRQTIGDTLGIGGIIRTLRTAPIMLAIGNDMAELCPGAWLLNYTNPMAMICQLVYQGTPQKNVVGLCHSVQGTMELIAGLCGVPVDEVTYFGAGINHQTFLYRLEHEGGSIYPLLDGRSRRNPTSCGACASTCTSASGTSRRSRASTRRSTRPGTCATTPRSSACASRSPTTSAAAPRASTSTRPSRPSSRPGSRSRSSAAGSTPR